MGIHQKTLKMLKLCAIALGTLATIAKSDTPADCHYEVIKGKWTFHYTDSGLVPEPKGMCHEGLDYKNEVTFELSNINMVTRLDERASTGWFTLIYNQGFEVIIDERKWFAFFDYSDCSKTVVGNPVHDVMSNDWACFYGVHVENEVSVAKKSELEISELYHKYKQLNDLKIHEKIGLELAEIDFNHPSIEKQTKKTALPTPPKSAKQLLSEIQQAKTTVAQADTLSATIPQDFDWLASGFVSPVKDQQSCGSCYAFAANGMFEARARVQTNNQWQPLFSEQDVVTCTDYAQGCSGGFPYLISKYGQDFGVVEESCGASYTAGDDECATDSGCFRHRVSDYGYVGDFYGGCTEYAMRQEIFENGPVAVSLNAAGLGLYTPGTVWIQPTAGLSYDPFEYTTHVVTITGWGWQDGLPFWNVKNSWGESFGNDGYFKIIRGIDNANIESLVAKCTMVPPVNV